MTKRDKERSDLSEQEVEAIYADYETCKALGLTYAMIEWPTALRILDELRALRAERARHAPLVAMLRALIDPHHDFYLYAADDKEPRMAIHRALQAFDEGKP